MKLFVFAALTMCDVFAGKYENNYCEATLIATLSWLGTRMSSQLRSQHVLLSLRPWIGVANPSFIKNLFLNLLAQHPSIALLWNLLSPMSAQAFKGLTPMKCCLRS